MKFGKHSSTKADITVNESPQDRILKLIAASKSDVPKSIRRHWIAATGSHRLEQARDFARRGWHVFPCWWAVDGRCACTDARCERVGKHPLGTLVHSGEKEATTDVAQIADWWAREPLANIGIATGPSGLVVLDIDPRHGGDASLLDLTEGISAAHLAKLTYSVETPGDGDRRGHHFYFRAGTAAFKSRIRVRPGIDVRGNTGYVIAASSSGANGDYVCVNNVEPVAVPSLLRATLLKPPIVDAVQQTDAEDWVTTALRGVSHGQRDDTCTRLAGHFVGKGEAPATVELLLREFGQKCDPPFPQSEVRKVIESVIRMDAEKGDSGFEDISEPLSAFVERVAAQPRSRMLIDDLIPEGTTLFHGQPRAGKTLAVEECLVAIATNTPAFGLQTFRTGDPIPVWYVTDEDTERDVSTRFEWLCGARGIMRLPENLRLSVCKGLSLDSQNWQSRIIETVRRHNIQIVCFDPLRSVTTNTDEGPGKFNIPAQFLRRLRRETNCRSIWLVHHDSKPSRTGRQSRDLPQRASGGAIFAFSDSPIHVERVNDMPFLSRVTPSHFKFMPSPAPFEFKLDISNNGVFRLVGSRSIGPLENRRINRRTLIVQFVKDHPRSTKNAIAEAVGGNRKNVLDEVSALGAAGVLVCESDQWSVANTPQAP